MNAMEKMFNDMLRARAEALKASITDVKAKEKERVDALKLLRESHEALQSACESFNPTDVDALESAIYDVRAAERTLEQLDDQDELIDAALRLLMFSEADSKGAKALAEPRKTKKGGR